jgi:hypothetical protein
MVRIVPRGFGSLLELIGDARLVLIGEASHGTHEFYRTRAELTKALILEISSPLKPTGLTRIERTSACGTRVEVRILKQRSTTSSAFHAGCGGTALKSEV